MSRNHTYEATESPLRDVAPENVQALGCRNSHAAQDDSVRTPSPAHNPRHPVAGEKVQALTFQGETVHTPLADVLRDAAHWLSHLEDDPYDLVVNNSDTGGWCVILYVGADVEVGW